MYMTPGHFRNTLGAVRMCIAALEKDEELCEEEFAAANKMLEVVLDFCQTSGIIDAYDPEQINFGVSKEKSVEMFSLVWKTSCTENGRVSVPVKSMNTIPEILGDLLRREWLAFDATKDTICIGKFEEERK